MHDYPLFLGIKKKNPPQIAVWLEDKKEGEPDYSGGSEGSGQPALVYRADVNLDSARISMRKMKRIVTLLESVCLVTYESAMYLTQYVENISNHAITASIGFTF